MNPKKAQRIVIGSMTIVGVLSAVDSIAEGEEPNVRILIGTVAAGAFLLAGSELAPELVAGLAILAAFATALRNRNTIGTVTNRVTGSVKTAQLKGNR